MITVKDERAKKQDVIFVDAEGITFVDRNGVLFLMLDQFANYQQLRKSVILGEVVGDKKLVPGTTSWQDKEVFGELVDVEIIVKTRKQ